jgi:hypothetical protein
MDLTAMIDLQRLLHDITGYDRNVHPLEYPEVAGIVTTYATNVLEPDHAAVVEELYAVDPMTEEECAEELELELSQVRSMCVVALCTLRFHVSKDPRFFGYLLQRYPEFVLEHTLLLRSVFDTLVDDVEKGGAPNWTRSRQRLESALLGARLRGNLEHLHIYNRMLARMMRHDDYRMLGFSDGEIRRITRAVQ